MKCLHVKKTVQCIKETQRLNVTDCEDKSDIVVQGCERDLLLVRQICVPILFIYLHVSPGFLLLLFFLLLFLVVFFFFFLLKQTDKKPESHGKEEQK